MAGSATFTIETSRTIIRSPRQRTARASHFARLSVIVIFGSFRRRSRGSTHADDGTHRLLELRVPMSFGRSAGQPGDEHVLRARPDRACRPAGSLRAYLRAPDRRALETRNVRRCGSA